MYGFYKELKLKLRVGEIAVIYVFLKTMPSAYKIHSILIGTVLRQ
jgi:hypothetical protein